MGKLLLFLIVLLLPATALARPPVERRRVVHCVESLYRLSASPDCPFLIEIPKEMVIWALTDGMEGAARTRTRLRKGAQIPHTSLRARSVNTITFTSDGRIKNSGTALVIEYRF